MIIKGNKTEHHHHHRTTRNRSSCDLFLFILVTALLSSLVVENIGGFVVVAKTQDHGTTSRNKIVNQNSLLSKTATMSPGGAATDDASTTTKQRNKIVYETIKKIQNDIIGTDAGNRGMKTLIVDDDLIDASYVLATLPKGSTVIVLSGFPCCVTQTPPTETDGPPGTYAIARAAYALGHTVIVVTDECNKDVFQAGLDNLSVPTFESEEGTAPPPISLEAFPSDPLNETDEQRLQDMINKCDLLISCERAGPGQDGVCYTMRGINMNEKGLIAPLHRFVTERNNKKESKKRKDPDGDTTNTPPYAFIAVGDGGNELGMGKVLSKIIESPKISKGELIGCAISADYLIAASVSNWGGYALAATAALVKAAISTTKEKDQEAKSDKERLSYWVNRCVPTDEEEIELLNRCVKAGCRDGVSGEMEATVDGMPLETSLQCLRDIRTAVLSCEFDNKETK